MIGMTVCSGIGAPEQAAPWIDWQYQSEIEAFPSAVLKVRFPAAVNLGDMTKFKEWPDAIVDVLVGGTPCQSFSVAGLRKGLDDPRGNLMLTFLAIADRYRPRWIVWENVPGVLSSNGGRDFGSFLGGLGQLGYGWAYRVLDAQYVRTPRFPHAVPQRRRRVFVVGCLGAWAPAAAVLFEPEGMQGHPAPRREAGQDVAGTLSARTQGGGLGTDFDLAGGQTAARRLRAQPQLSHREDQDTLICSTGNVAHCLNAGGMGRQDFETETMVAHSLRGEGFDASEDGTGRATPIVPVAFDCKGSEVQAAPSGHSVRRLTPTECERLMGMPDGWTQIPYRNKSADQCPDGPRYKALGNSWAVNCGEFIFERIKAVEEMLSEKLEAAE